MCAPCRAIDRSCHKALPIVIEQGETVLCCTGGLQQPSFACIVDRRISMAKAVPSTSQGRGALVTA
eukprot:851726-Amphidinium_carterae.1